MSKKQRRNGKLGKLPRAQIRIMDNMKYELIDNLPVDADMIWRVRELVEAGAYPNMEEALRAALKLLVVENVGTIVRYHQLLGLIGG